MCQGAIPAVKKWHMAPSLTTVWLTWSSDEAGAQGLSRRNWEDVAPTLLGTGNSPLAGKARWLLATLCKTPLSGGLSLSALLLWGG